MTDQESKRKVRRIRRPLTEPERAHLAETRATLDAHEKEEILVLAKRFRAARRQGLAILHDALRLLAKERQTQGVSLQTLSERTGIAKGNLSRLENDEQANPTLATITTLADALGKDVLIVLADKASNLA
jgi:DNA-binding Xre family transcriptional regulator